MPDLRDTDFQNADGVSPVDDPGLTRPSLPPAWYERIRDMAYDRGLSLGRIAGSVLAIAATAAVGWWLLRPAPAPIESSLPVETSASAQSGDVQSPRSEPLLTTTAPAAVAVVAHAAGAVVHPGLYRLRPGARVADLLDAAGGLTPEGDGDRLNLAAPLADGERVYVLTRGEEAVPEAVAADHPPGQPASPDGGSGAGSAQDDPVDINEADAAELDSLPGVGPSTAQAIIDYRTENGRFTSADELLDVRGIGEAKLAQMRDRVRV